MADTKISALPASTTPLAGTEALPIVQSGVTKQVSVANLTAGRAISATQLTLSTGNLIVASGQGIDFSADPSAPGMTSELFDDYEEGTWTPAWGGTTGNPSCTYSTQTGTYTKIGNRVTCFCEISTATTSGGSGNLRILGLPFTVSSGLSLKADYAVTFLSNFPSGGVGSGTLATLSGTFAPNEQSYLPLANLLGTSYLLATITYFA
jgi:hypothetical protein